MKKRSDINASKKVTTTTPAPKLRAEELAIVKKYGHLFSNTGGNDLQELLERQDVNLMNNAVVTLMKVSCEGQLGMLLRLEKEGLLK